MSKKKTNNVKNNYQHFKATIGTISEELDYFGNFKEVLSLDKVYLKTRGDKPVVDYAVINRNKATETLFELAQKGLANQVVSFDGKILDCRHVQLYEGMNFLHNESHCKIGYIKNINIHYKNKSKVTVINRKVIYDKK
jgi:hypothetical protein